MTTALGDAKLAEGANFIRAAVSVDWLARTDAN
jgi:hypothetical protein